MDADLAVLDTNVLVAATHPPRAGHEAALTLLDGTRALAVTTQVIREYLVVATRPVDKNGLALSSEQAVINIEALLDRFTVLAEDHRVSARLRQLVVAGRASGLPIHDANIAAAALVHGATSIITANRRHFERFADLIEIEDLN